MRPLCCRGCQAAALRYDHMRLGRTLFGAGQLRDLSEITGSDVKGKITPYSSRNPKRTGRVKADDRVWMGRTDAYVDLARTRPSGDTKSGQSIRGKTVPQTSSQLGRFLE